MLSAQIKNAVPYTTKPGDTLWGITERFYGNEDLWSLLGQANRISDPNGLGQVELILPRELEGAKIKFDRLDVPAHRFKARSIPPRRIQTLLYEVVLAWGGELWVVPVGRRTDRKAATELMDQLLSDVTVEIFPDRLHALVSCELIRQGQGQGLDWRMDDVRNVENGLIFERKPKEFSVRVDDWLIDGTLGRLGGTRNRANGDAQSETLGIAAASANDIASHL